MGQHQPLSTGPCGPMSIARNAAAADAFAAADRRRRCCRRRRSIAALQRTPPAMASLPQPGGRDSLHGSADSDGAHARGVARPLRPLSVRRERRMRLRVGCASPSRQQHRAAAVRVASSAGLRPSESSATSARVRSQRLAGARLAHWLQCCLLLLLLLLHWRAPHQSAVPDPADSETAAMP
jgi:hypothetical protein